LLRLVWCGVLSVALTGCALHRTQSSTPTAAPLADTAAEGKTADAAASLEAFMAQVRQRAAEARSTRVPAATIEGQDPRLGAALTLASARPSPESYRAVAREYSRVQVTDRAIDYLKRALDLDRRDWATYDASARVWRNAGSLNIALGDAHRAVYFAPRSAVARNTLGTVLQALGQRRRAREQYEFALRLDPAASYALNNLCYGWILDGDAPKAAHACETALNLNPELSAARNNLGILYAAGGDLEGARTSFERAGDRATVSYNLGIMHLARREYQKAASAFSDAQEARPTRQTAARVRQAMALSLAGGIE
jgi:tetratricopeptide (TPR) repeat protein